MYKKIILTALVVQSLSIQAVNWWKVDPRYWFWGTHPALPKAPFDAANHVLGIATSNGVTITENAVELGKTLVQGAEKAGEKFVQGAEILRDPAAIEAASYAAGHGASHGFMYGLFSGSASAVRDGAQYVKDGAAAHPYVTATAASAALLGGAYYKFRPLTEEEQEQAEIKKAKRFADLRAARTLEVTDATADEFRTCLNTHARCGDRGENGLPKRCNSPARRLGQLNRARAADIAAAFKEYQ